MRAVLLTALATAVLLTGCGSDEPADDKPVLGMEAPTPSGPPTEAPKPTAKPTPNPPAKPKALGKTLPVKILGPGPPVLETEAQSKSTGSVTSQILEAMRLRTDLMAGYKGATGGRCDRGRVRLAADATTNCTVSYRGHPVRWSVTISDDYKSGSVFIQYQIYPMRAVLLSKAVYSEWWATNKSTGIARAALQQGPAGDRGHPGRTDHLQVPEADARGRFGTAVLAGLEDQRRRLRRRVRLELSDLAGRGP